MVEDTFQQVDELVASENNTMEIVEEAFEITNGLQEEANVGNGNNSANELPINIEEERKPLGKVTYEDGPQDNNFDPIFLEDAIKGLYRGSKCIKLAATMLLMNLCTIHGVNNKFADELFTLLHFHLLPRDNCLLNNYYVAKSLTKSLGLDYKNIHVCGKGCVLF